MGEPFLIESSYKLSDSIGEIIETLISKVSNEYDGRLDDKIMWLQDTRHLLAHIFACSLNRKKDEIKWVSFPISNKKLVDKIPQALSTKLGHTRGLDVLTKLNILDSKPFIKKQQCTQLKISDHVYSLIKEQFLETRKSEKCNELRFYDIRNNSIQDFKFSGRVEVLKRPQHDLSNLYGSEISGRQPPKVIEHYRKSLDKLIPVRVNIDTIIDHIEKLKNQLSVKNSKSEIDHSDICRILQVENALVTILNRYKLISEKPFIVEYYPTYKVAKIGGRLFEAGCGVQNLPSGLKQKCLVGYNFDLVSSQLNIIKLYAKKYLNTDDIGFNSVDEISNFLEVDRKTAKNILYGTIFNCGEISPSPLNTVFKKIETEYGKEIAQNVIRKWKHNNKLIPVIKNLLQTFKTSGDFSFKNNGKKYLKNDVGIKIDSLKIDDKQILSHIIQGLEAKYLLDVIDLNEGDLSALEHDGFVIANQKPKSPDIEGLNIIMKSYYEEEG